MNIVTSLDRFLGWGEFHGEIFYPLMVPMLIFEMVGNIDIWGFMFFGMYGGIRETINLERNG